MLKPDLRLIEHKPVNTLRLLACRLGSGTSPRAGGLSSLRRTLESPLHTGPGGRLRTSRCPTRVLSGVLAAARG